jgi:hypothetical protein
VISIVTDTGLLATLVLNWAVIWLNINQTAPGDARSSPVWAPETPLLVAVRSPVIAALTVGVQKVAVDTSGDRTKGPFKFTFGAPDAAEGVVTLKLTVLIVPKTHAGTDGFPEVSVELK